MPKLPFLGLGLATEYESRLARTVVTDRLDQALGLGFLEFGGDVEHGLDETMRVWRRESRPATYHILDFNVSQSDPMDPPWAAATRAMVGELGAPWVTGDIGYWHYGRMLRDNMALVHPLLDQGALDVTAENIRLLTDVLGAPYYPENPPFYFAMGSFELLDFYARLLEAADCRMVLDCSHLNQYQYARGRRATDGLADFPLDRIVELHLAGGAELTRAGHRALDDAHHGTVPHGALDIARFACERGDVRAICLEMEMSRTHDIEGTIVDVLNALAATPFARQLNAGSVVA